MQLCRQTTLESSDQDDFYQAIITISSDEPPERLQVYRNDQVIFHQFQNIQSRRLLEIPFAVTQTETVIRAVLTFATKPVYHQKIPYLPLELEKLCQSFQTKPSLDLMLEVLTLPFG